MSIKFNALNCSFRHLLNLTSVLMTVNSVANKKIDGFFSTSDLINNLQAGSSQSGKTRLGSSDQTL